jgi:hypothetical protein
MAANGQQERAGRSPRWIDASVRGRGKPEVCATISNISNSGCRIETAAPLRSGELIEIVVPRLGSISAYIRWTEKGHSGAEFVTGSETWLNPDPDSTAYGGDSLHKANGRRFG